MHIEQLSYFLHVAETGSINSAAQRFFISQQAINIQLRKLEDELDINLLKRTQKGVTLTPQGHLFIPYAQNILEQYNEAKYKLQKFTKGEMNLAGTLSIFSSSIFSDLFLPSVINSFTQFHPNTAIRIIDVNSEDLLTYLSKNYCDLILFSTGKKYLQETLLNNFIEDINIIPLLDDTMVLCARPDHPLMRYKAIDHDLLTYYVNKEKMQISLYQVTPIVMPETARMHFSSSNNVNLHKELMWSGNSVTHMPKLAYLNKFQKDGFACVPVPEADCISHCLIYRNEPNNQNYELIKCFSDFVHKQFLQRFGTK